MSDHPSNGKVTNVVMRDAGGNACFTISLVNVRKEDILTFPNDIVGALRNRYPYHQPTLMDVHDVDNFWLRP